MQALVNLADVPVIELKSDADFARDGVMKPGTVAYFPEGVFYGPQSISGESATLVLQFGGASGSGYISEADRAKITLD